MTAQLQAQLDNAYYVWLTTARADGMPQPTPVWFIWSTDRTSLLVLSLPEKQQKLTNITNNNKVAVNWSSNTGWPYVVIMGTAQIDALTDDEKAAYIAKYDKGIRELNMTPESFIETYNAVIRITPERTRGDM